MHRSTFHHLFLIGMTEVEMPRAHRRAASFCQCATPAVSVAVTPASSTRLREKWHSHIVYSRSPRSSARRHAMDSTAPAAPLPVEFRRGFATLAPSASIDAFGRDVLGVMVRPLPCNYQSGGSATLAGSRLDIVITLIDLGPVPCAVLPGSSVDSVVVHGVPAGTYDAALHLRVVSGGDGGRLDDRPSDGHQGLLTKVLSGCFGGS